MKLRSVASFLLTAALLTALHPLTATDPTVMAKLVAQSIPTALPRPSPSPAPDDLAWLRANGALLFHDAFEREETGNGAKAIGNGWNSAAISATAFSRRAASP